MKMSNFCVDPQLLQNMASSSSLPSAKNSDSSSFYSYVSSLQTPDLYSVFSTSGCGLPISKISSLQLKYGLNLLEDDEKCSALRHLFACLFNPLNAILTILSIVMYYSDDEDGCVIVFVMILLSSLLTFAQEYRASNDVKKLQKLLNYIVMVSRVSDDSGHENTLTVEMTSDSQAENQGSIVQSVSIKELVPGDLIILKAGDMVPADLRLIEANYLKINQAAMTGEPLSVEKNCSENENISEDFSLFDYPNLVFQGTSVVSGWGKGIIMKTGKSTMFGKLKKGLAQTKTRTAFEVGINQYIYMMLFFMVILMTFTLIVNLVFKQYDLLEAIKFSMAVAVGMIPEMLPMIVTVNLAKGAVEMGNKEMIVKKLDAIQNMGAMDVLCIEKTGTLTEDKIMLEDGFNENLEKSNYPIELAYYSSKMEEGSRNLLNLAIEEYVESDEKATKFAEKFKDLRKLEEIPFDYNRECVSVLVQDKNLQKILLTKGSVEEMLQKTSFHVTSRFSNSEDQQLIGIADLRESLDSAKKNEIQERVIGLNRKGYKVLAVSYKILGSGSEDCRKMTEAFEKDLTLVGLLAFRDPPKPSSEEFLLKLKEKGLDIKILTGDNPYNTQFICSQVGLQAESKDFITGPELAALPSDKFAEAVKSFSLFAKLTPELKESIVIAMQKQGRIVGYFGDGIGDSQALKAADCSMSVENGADIAKQCANIILLRNNLELLSFGVEEGRKTFGNIVKYLKMSASSNFGNVISLSGTSCLFSFLPITAVQLLFQNLLYDISQCGVAFDNVDFEYLREPRKWQIKDVARFMIIVGSISSIFDFSMCGVIWYYFGNHGETTSDVTEFQTAWFIYGLIAQTLIVHIIRTHKIPFIESHASTILTVTTGIVTVLAIWIPYTALADYVPFIAPSLMYYPFLVANLLAYGILCHFGKMAFYKFYGLK